MSVIALPSSDSVVSSRTRRGPYQPSPKRTTANRLNALKSTGPRTPEGKSKVAHNALKHGRSQPHPLCSPHASDPDTDPDYAMFLEELRADLKPATPTQHHLFPLIADLLWRLRRLPHAQQSLFTDPDASPCAQLAQAFLSENPHNPFLLLARYERSLQNALCRLLTQFRTITKELTKNPRASYAPDEPPCPPERAWPYPITKQTHSTPSPSVSSVSSVAHPSPPPRLRDRTLEPENLPFLTREEIQIAIAANQLPPTFTRPPIPPGCYEEGDDEAYSSDEYAPTKQTHSPTPIPPSEIHHPHLDLPLSSILYSLSSPSSPPSQTNPFTISPLPPYHPPMQPLTLPRFCFGTNILGWTVDSPTSFALLDHLLAKGFNFLDTADLYSRWAPNHTGGESESIIGHWSKQRRNRDQLLIATKVGMDMGNGNKGLRQDYILRAAEASLTRLQTDYIDLYQSHQDDPATPLDETLAAYDQLLKQGKVRHIGASNYTAERLSASLASSRNSSLPRYQTLQPEYNLYDRDGFERELLPLCQREHLAVIPYFSLAAGFLTGKYRADADLSKSPRGQGVGKKYLNPRGHKILAALDDLSKSLRATPAQISLAWLLTRPTIAAPIASATTIPQLDELLAATTLKLDPDSLKLLETASAP